MQGMLLFTASFRSSEDTAASCRMCPRGCLTIPEMKLQYVSLTIHFYLVPNQKTSSFLTSISSKSLHAVGLRHRVKPTFILYFKETEENVVRDQTIK